MRQELLRAATEWACEWFGAEGLGLRVPVQGAGCRARARGGLWLMGEGVKGVVSTSSVWADGHAGGCPS